LVIGVAYLGDVTPFFSPEWRRSPAHSEQFIEQTIRIAMKTTLDIPEPLLRDARMLAAREGTTLKALVEQGLRQIVFGSRWRKDEARRPGQAEPTCSCFRGSLASHWSVAAARHLI